MMSKELLEKQGYRFVDNHSAIKVCEWTRKSLSNQGVCYKEKFYGIKSHRCCQMTPSLICPNSCVYCWRTMTKDTIGKELKCKLDEPSEIIDGCIEMQRNLMNGFPGNKNLNLIKFKEAQNPLSFAISLTGEPTLYPYLRDLIKELKNRKIISFLVTNGQFPKALENLNPNQLYVSLDAPTKEIYKKIDKPVLKDYWERLNESLEILSALKTRRVLRLTLIKGINLSHEKEYAKLIEKANPDFIECKGYMWLGGSREKLKYENIPIHKEIQDFSKKLAEETGLKVLNEDTRSRVCLLGS